MLTKLCPKCRVCKEASAFSKNAKSKDGLYHSCKSCKSKADKEYDAINKAREHIIIPEFQTCPACNTKKLGTDFPKNTRNTTGLSSHCKECEAKEAKARAKKNKAREVVVVPDFKSCPDCNLNKPNSDFHRIHRNKSGLSCYCKKCSTIRHREFEFGVTKEQYNSILAAQGGACAICKFIPGPEGIELDLDHKHDTDIIRGLLHRNCNLGLGFFNDNISLLARGIQYLSGEALGIQYKRRMPKHIKEQILISQDYKCKICSADLHKKRACLDHCHKTGMVRGYLCHNCNSGLGYFNDSVELLQSAIDYLKKYEFCIPDPTIFLTIQGTS